MNIAVVGTGYVGLVTGTCFAETGNHVVCVDIDAAKVNKMKNGQVPIYEPHLDVLYDPLDADLAARDSFGSPFGPGAR